MRAASGEYGFSGDFTDAIAWRCMAASQNILRQKTAWNMCVNLAWITCATKGKLPGQRGREMHFALAPRDLSWWGYEDPGSTGSWWMEPRGQTFAVSDVYYAEVAILNRLCGNAQSLFGVGRGATFECDEDADGLPELRRLLVGW
jgi:hypothetical protein